MDKRNWLIIAVTWLILLVPAHAGGVPQQGQSAQKQTASRSQSFGSNEAHKADPLTQPCKPGEDNRGSELCAQWKSADAAQESADWTRRTFWTAIVGLVIGALTFAAAVAAAVFAKFASDHAKAGANAADAAVIETRRIGEVQVRAYPSVVSVHVRGITNGLPDFVVNIRNSGNSPALRMKSRGRLMLSYQKDILPEGTVAQYGMEISVVSHAQVPIPPNSEGEISVYVPHCDDDAERKVTMEAMASNSPRKHPFWTVNFFFDWFDVFGDKYCFYINAVQFSSASTRKIVGEVDAMDERVLESPFSLTYQSESRKVEGES